ncbi:MAG: VanW family protein [Lachnospiraceae bacterium]|nr:VanW family protein [Lachnospiraceae bacterium]
MKRNHAYGIAAAAVLSAAAVTQTICPVQASAAVILQTTVYDGLTVGPVEIGGMTKEEAKKAVNEYVEELLTKKVTLSLQGSDEKIEVTVEDTGFSWVNQEVIDEVAGIGKSGNVVRRYKAKKDIEYVPQTFEIEFAVDEAKIRQCIEMNREALEVQAVDAVLEKTEDGFSIIPEKNGITVDVDVSVQTVKNYLLNEWNYEDCTVQLAGAELIPSLTKAECQKIQSEPMAEFMTAYKSSSEARCGNIDAAVDKINGTLLLPGERFSCLEHMVPFTAENGYFPAGSYLNGKLVDSFGGGVCQVSTTLYNAVLLAELEVNQRNNHGLTVGYVQLSSDAAIAESSGMDFIFTNNTNAPVYLEGFTKNKTVTFRIYGMDERPENRTLEFKHVVTEVLEPPADVVTEDPALPAGTTQVTQSSHTGYRAELYKYIYIDGVETGREKVNSSYYAPAPNYVSVGPGTVLTEEPAGDTPADVPADIPVDVPSGVAPADPSQQQIVPPSAQEPGQSEPGELKTPSAG